MSKNPLGKSRKVENPYATFKAIVRGDEFEIRILKTYKLAKNETNDPYARWFTVAKSPMTFGSWEYGDSYRKEITDLRLKNVAKGCGITLITAGTAFLLFFEGVPLN